MTLRKMAPRSTPRGFAPPSASSPFSASTSSSNLFASNRPNGPITAGKKGPSMNGSKSTDLDNEDEQTLYLDPSAYKRSEKGKWKESGRTLLAAVSPVGGEIATWVGPTGSDNANQQRRTKSFEASDNVIYFSNPDELPDPLLTFYTETYTLFTSLQRIVSLSMTIPSPADKDGLDGVSMGSLPAETVGHMATLVGMYLEELAKLREKPEVEDDDRARYDAAYHILHLAQILYLPRDGRGEGLLGEEMLDWVNDVDPAPDNKLGNEIMQTRPQWEHPSFWPYLSQCILRGFHLPASSFLRTLVDHPHKPISDLASLLSSHLSRFPRSTNTVTYPLDHQFLSAHRRWLSTFRGELIASLKGRDRGHWLDSEEDAQGDRESEKQWSSWENEFRTVVDLMEGKPEKVLEEAGDWREAMGAWGVLVDVNLRRDDLATTLQRINEKIPVDPTILDDSIQNALCKADISTALTGCHDLDKWLAAHLGDIFDKLGMIVDDDEKFDMSIRDYFILDYVDVIAGNPRFDPLWRMICEYLATAGPEGKCRVREYVVHIALHIASASSSTEHTKSSRSSGGMEVDEDDVADEMQVDGKNSTRETEVDDDGLDSRFRRFAEVRETCNELGLSEQWRTISRIVADQLFRRGELGVAATMCLQAEDGNTLSRISEQILDSFISQGEEEYIRLVESLPPSLLTEAPLALANSLDPSTADDDQPLPLDLPGKASISVFASRLAFLAEFRDYLLFRKQDARDRAADKLINLLTAGIAPVRFWAVILSESVPLLEDPEILLTSNDTFELMRVLEDVEVNVATAPREYLTDLAQLLGCRRASAAGQDKAGNKSKSSSGKLDLEAARRNLEEVRLALARNLARALVVNFDNPF